MGFHPPKICDQLVEYNCVAFLLDEDVMTDNEQV